MLSFYGGIRCPATYCNLLSGRSNKDKGLKCLERKEGQIFAQETLKQLSSRKKRDFPELKTT